LTAALVGCTGFVGGNLAAAGRYDVAVHRADVDLLRGRRFERVVCAGLPAAKWVANRDPEADRANVERLEAVLATVSAERFVLVSTVDVYPRPTGCDENTDCTGEPNHAYGTNRLRFERFVRAHFPAATILRLPALFGPGLRKNVVYDLLHDNGLAAINPQSRFQWYPVARLASDIALAEAAGIALANLCPEPVATREILERCFPDKVVGAQAAAAASYDVRTKYAAHFGGRDGYVMNARAVLDALGAYVAQERATC
jgi:nucleoside-diphosphate-sugar epimerase